MSRQDSKTAGGVFAYERPDAGNPLLLTGIIELQMECLHNASCMEPRI